jgi:hypothetical protein
MKSHRLSSPPANTRARTRTSVPYGPTVLLFSEIAASPHFVAHKRAQQFWMDLIALRQIGHRCLFPHRFQRDLRLQPAPIFRLVLIVIFRFCCDGTAPNPISQPVPNPESTSALLNLSPVLRRRLSASISCKTSLSEPGGQKRDFPLVPSIRKMRWNGTSSYSGENMFCVLQLRKYVSLGQCHLGQRPPLRAVHQGKSALSRNWFSTRMCNYDGAVSDRHGPKPKVSACF